MTEHLYPAIFALFIWWFSTGVIIYLDGLPRHTFKWSMIGATAVLSASFYGFYVTANDTSLRGAYLAFTFGVLAWGWQEIAFFMGFVTGPRKQACPKDCRGIKHFWHGVEVGLWHELAIIAAFAAILWLTWGGANQIGLWTFTVLWLMRQSAKLNVFFGVRNLSEEFLPDHLDYLKRYLTKRPMNLLFPVSVTLSTVICVLLFERAFASGATPFDAVGYTFLGVLLALAILEHWFLVLPLPAAKLWHWGLKSRQAQETVDTEIASGFLGSGKTTLLSRLFEARNPAESALGQSVAPLAAADAHAEHHGTMVSDEDHAMPPYQQAHPLTALGLKSFSARLSAPCEAQPLRNLLESIGAGAYGDVDRVKGIVRSGSGWLRFDLAGGRSRITAFAADKSEEPRFVAIGKSIDGPRLEMAFGACHSQAQA